MYWIERAPLVLIGLVFFASLVLAHELAFLAGRRSKAKPAVSSETRGYLVSSALALLALLMAFTFSAAHDRFRLRQQLVVDEANAIGTSYLRVQLLDQPWRERLSGELLTYAETRARFGRTRSAEEIAANARETAAIQDAIWRDMEHVVRVNPIPDLNVALLMTLNETFDLAASARAARDARVPVTVLRSLLLCSVMAAAIVGYTEASERRWTGVLAGVLLLFTFAFVLILDLDRPTSGRVLVSQAPMQRAIADIRRSEAAKRPPPPAPSPPPRR
jgi:hypothetical protein